METTWESRWLPDSMKIMSHAIKRLEAHDVVYKNGGVAQLGEHLPCKQGVKSSNLSVSIRGL